MQSDSGQQYAPAGALRNDDKFAIWSQQLDAELEELSHRLNGETKEYDSGERKYVWKTGDSKNAVMNKAGVSYLISSMRSFCNKSVTLSSFTRTEAKELAFERALALVNTLVLNKKNYELKHEHLEDIGATVMQIFVSTSMRAVGNGERNFLSRTGIEQTLRQYVGQEKQGPKVF